MKRVTWCAPGLFVCAILSGCGESQGNVTGTVTMDGQPVSSGSITFVKAEGGQVREGAVIKDGGFQAKLPPGKYKIELSGQKAVGKRTQKGFDGKDEVLEITEPLFPDRYNTKTELSEDIKSGSNTLKLDLKSTK
jgi:hypothetical protein